MNELSRVRLEPLLSTASKPKPHAIDISTALSVVTVQGGKPEPHTCPYCRGAASWEPDEYRMECEHCATMYCWPCGTPLEDEDPAWSIHHQWWNIFGCQGLDKPKRAHNLAWDTIVLQLVIGIFAGIPALLCGLVIGLISGIFWPCVQWLHTSRKRAFLFSVNVVGMTLVYAIVPVTIVVMLPFYPVVWVYRRCFPSDDPPKNFLF